MGIVFYYVLYVLWCDYVGLDFVLLFLCCFIWVGVDYVGLCSGLQVNCGAGLFCFGLF